MQYKANDIINFRLEESHRILWDSDLFSWLIEQ
jgi:hypothetical protein